MAAELQPCGTPAAYKRHRDYRQKPCAEAQAANNRRTYQQRRLNHDIRELVHVLACALGVGRKL